MNTEPEWTTLPSDRHWQWEGQGYAELDGKSYGELDSQAVPNVVVRIDCIECRAQIVVGQTYTSETVCAISGKPTVIGPSLVHQRCTFDLPVELMLACETLWIAKELQDKIPELLLRYTDREDLLGHTYYWSRFG